MDEYLFNCNRVFEDIPKEIQSYLNKNQDISWINTFGIEIHEMDRNFFKQFQKLDLLMSKFKSHRHSIFKFEPNVCYGWHIDNPGRSCALNMLISGNLSHTFCGDTDNNIDYYNIKEVIYLENKFTLLNVKKHHTVYNLNNLRYLLSISFHPHFASFNKIKEYIIENDL